MTWGLLYMEARFMSSLVNLLASFIWQERSRYCTLRQLYFTDYGQFCRIEVQ